MYWLARSVCPLCAASFVSSDFPRAFSLMYVRSSWRFGYWIYFSVTVPGSVENVCVGDRPLSGVLHSLSVIVMLGVGDGCLYTDWILGECSELLDHDLVGERDYPVSSINLDGGLDIHPDLVLTSIVSASDGEALLSRVLCTS